MVIKSKDLYTLAFIDLNMNAKKLSITNENLKRIDSEIINLSHLFNTYLTYYSNALSYQLIQKEIKNVQVDLKQLSLTDDFDNLIAENIGHTLEAQIGLSDYLNNPKNKDISDVLFLFFGDCAQQEMEKVILNFDTNGYKRMFQRDDEAKERIKSLKQLGNPQGDISELIRNGVLKYGRDLRLMDKDYDFKVELNDTIKRTYWDNITNTCVLQPQLLRPTLIGEEEIISLSELYFFTIHEVLGHGFHQRLSDTLLNSISYKGTASSLIAKSHTEGVACVREVSALNYLIQHATEYHLSVEDLIFVGKFKEYAGKLQVVCSYNSLVKSGAIKNIKKGVIPKLEKINQIHRDYCPDSMPHLQVPDAIRELSYYFGKKLIENIKISNEGFPESELDKTLNTGVWTYQSLPKLVTFLLKEKTA